MLKNLACTRLDEAKILLDNGKYEGAYYLSGYVIELALKACIAKQTEKYDFPDKRFVNDNHTHEITILLTNSGLKQEFKDEIQINGSLEKNWSHVKDWSPESRYKNNSKEDAVDLFSAVSDINGGIFEWIKQRW